MIVLKSPRGICLQLESGKVIAIRASGAKGGGESVLTGGKPAGSSDDVIDMTNDEDELDNALFKANALNTKESLPPPPPIEQLKIPKPNIVPRKIKNPSDGSSSLGWNSQNSSSSSKDLNNYSSSSKFRKLIHSFFFSN